MSNRMPMPNAGNNANLSPDIFQLAVWLLKEAAISFNDATEYSKELISLGFESPRALIHKATVEDLQKAGIKNDHLLRILKAIMRQTGSGGPESLTGTTVSVSESHNTSCNQLGDSKMSSIPVIRCKRCTIICEYEGQTTSFVVKPGHAGLMICTTSSPSSMSSPRSFTIEKMDDEGAGMVILSPPAFCSPHVDPIRWSVGEVGAWAKSILGVKDVITLFRDASVDGRALLSMVSEEDFKAVGVLEIAHRKLLLKNLYKLRQMRRTKNLKGLSNKRGSSGVPTTPSLERNEQHLKKQPMVDMGNIKPLNDLDLTNSSYSKSSFPPSNAETTMDSEFFGMSLAPTENSNGNMEEVPTSPFSPIQIAEPVSAAGVDVEVWPCSSATSCNSAAGGGNGNTAAYFLNTDSLPSTPVHNHGAKVIKEGKASNSKPPIVCGPSAEERRLFLGQVSSPPASDQSTPCNRNTIRGSRRNNLSPQQDQHSLQHRRPGPGLPARRVTPQVLSRPLTTTLKGGSDETSRSRSSEPNASPTPPHLELSNEVEPSGFSSEAVNSLSFHDLLRTNGTSVALPSYSSANCCEDTEKGNLAVCGAPDKSLQTAAPLRSVLCESSELQANAGGAHVQNGIRHAVSQISIGSMDGESICSGITPPSAQLCKSTLLLDELGRGAGGIVYRALHVPSLRIVAVKSIPLSEDQNRNQAVREICAMHDINREELEPVMNNRSVSLSFNSSESLSEMAQRAAFSHESPDSERNSREGLEENPGTVLQTHPHIVAFYDAYIDPEKECMCILLEQMEPGTLQCAVNSGRALAEDELAVVSRSVLQGLSRMHAQKKIHRDIKPSNILLDRCGKVKISDFGVVRDLASSNSIAKTFTGTLCYMSPERITGDDHSYSSDIWSLGLVLVTLARGAFPFARAGYWDILLAVQESPPPRLPGNYSTDACDFVACMLQKDPTKRHTAEQLLNHSFITNHKGKNRVVELVRELRALTAAQQNSVYSLNMENILARLVEYQAEVDIYDLVCLKRMRMMEKDAEDEKPLKLVIRCYHRSAFRTLARQLEAPSEELADTYNHLVTQMEFHCNNNLDEILEDYKHISPVPKIRFPETGG